MPAPATFSIIVETANLATADPDELEGALESLARQDLPVESASEVVIFQGDDVPPGLAEDLAQRYPWVRLERVGAASYAAMKAKASTLSTGEIVVWADSDCEYEPHWLAALLEPFADPGVEIVRGETALEITSPWALAQALVFSFPRFSGDHELTPVEHYHANNVAFRRAVLERVPVPDDPTMFRGHFIVHSAALRDAGCTIWRQPRARARHAPTEPRELPSRFLLLGRDSVRVGPAMGAPLPARRIDRLRHLRAGLLTAARRRLRLVVNEEPARARLLPLALPVAVVLAALYYAGRAASLMLPRS